MAASASGVRVLEECPYCKRRIFSGYTDAEKLFDVNAWDSSDVFTIWPLPRYVLATERVCDLIAEHRFSGVKALSIRNLPKVVAGTLTPGNLRDWFEEDRARQIEADIDEPRI